jgi:enediyne biosynthesis protein E4
VRITAGGRSQVDEVQSGSSYLSQNDLRLHFGLGAQKVVERLQIRWPNSNPETFENLRADHIYTVVEGRGIVAQQPVRSKPPK